MSGRDKKGKDDQPSYISFNEPKRAEEDEARERVLAAERGCLLRRGGEVVGERVEGRVPLVIGDLAGFAVGEVEPGFEDRNEVDDAAL